MLYRFVRGFNEIYGVTMLFAFVAAFFIAFAFTLVFPIVPIVMIVLSPFAVVFARGGMIVLRALEGAIARGALRQGRCPACGGTCDRVRVAAAGSVATAGAAGGVDLDPASGSASANLATPATFVHECTGCQRIFTERGEPYQVTPAEEPVPPAEFEAAGLA